MRHLKLLVCSLLGLVLGCAATAARAMWAEAVAGRPFGVGYIRLTSDEEFMPAVLGAQGLSVSAAAGRILNPAIGAPLDTRLVKELVLDSPWMHGGPIRQQASGILRGLLDRPAPTHIYFLFRGDGPLTVKLQSQTAHELVLQPRDDPYAHALLLAAWWRQYTAAPGGLFHPSGHYPPVVSNYLQSMLARRLGLPLGEYDSEGSWQDQLEGEIGFFLGTEKVRLAIARDRMLGRTPSSERATEPLPEPPEWPPLELPEVPADVKTEPIAARVPAECLYLRFGTFGNFLWFQDTLERWGGDLGNLVALRGLDEGQRRRMEQQLILKQTVLSRLLGPTVISDVAIVGTDMFLREGAAYGMLFEARNAFLLQRDIKRQRTERLAQGGVSESTVRIAGRDVSLIASPDGSVRSFYVADGGYVFVTTSETLARRFLETGGKGPSLARAADFRHARSVMPLARDDTVFIYLSDAFFQNMAGPRYWIEIYRRLQAAADIQLVEMAALASATEGKPGDSIDELVAGGFLPSGFGARADGSQALLADGVVRDSLRGRRGFFLPVADTPVEKVAPSEAAAYRQFVELCRSKWSRFDPMIVGIRRHGPTDGVERVVLDIEANPFDQRHFEVFSEWLGPANRDRLAPIAGDRVAMELQLSNQRLFGAIRGLGPVVDEVNGPYAEPGTWRDLLVGYMGTTGPLGFLGLLDRRVAAPPDAPGLAGQPGRMWRHRDEQFTVFSFHPEVLSEVCPQLRFEPAQRPAQLRLHVEDISRGRLAPSLSTMSYLRTRGTTLGNLRLLHAIGEQLRVPGPDARRTAELLLDARLVCPLGGRYEFRKRPDGSGYWTSTALADGADGRVPPGFAAPPLSWFRGLDADVSMVPRALSAHIEVLMQLPKKPLVSEPDEPPPEEVPPPAAVVPAAEEVSPQTELRP